VLVASGEKRMSTTIVEKYFETWNERDAARRLTLADETWTPTARYVDPQADVTVRPRSATWPPACMNWPPATSFG
jgi:hypothetical protein